MIKRVIWIVALSGILFYGLVQLIFYLSILLDSSNEEIEKNTSEIGYLVPPVLDALPEATNSAEVLISGYAQNAHVVEVYINGISKGKTDIATKDETFSFDTMRLYEGENEITAISYADGKKSNSSLPVIVQYKKGKPKLVVEYPEDGITVPQSQESIEIRGLTDPENTVTVNGRIARTLPDGTFRLKYQIGDGDTTIEIVSRDSAGNETKIVRTVHTSN